MPHLQVPALLIEFGDAAKQLKTFPFIYNAVLCLVRTGTLGELAQALCREVALETARGLSLPQPAFLTLTAGLLQQPHFPLW